MKFEESKYFLALTCVVIIMLLAFYYSYWNRKRIIQKEIGESAFKKLVPTWVGKFWPNNTFLIVSGVGFVALSLTNPQWGNQSSTISAKGIDLYIALDISNSMLADDVSPNRLEKSKKYLTELIDQLKGYRIGLIYFAGGAYLQMPLSADLSVAKLLINSANTNQAGNQGTAISESIDMAISTFEKDNESSKLMLIVTDGETHDEASMTSAEKAKSMGISIFSVGVGTEKGGLIPYGGGYKLDENGQQVYSVLNKELIKDLANAGGGKSYFLNNENQDSKGLIDNMNDMASTSVSKEIYSVKGSYFQLPLAVGIFLLIWGFAIQAKKTNE